MENVKFIRLQFVDINGSIKSLAISPNNLKSVINEGIVFDGSSVEGYARIHESDMILKPDISTFNILPWGNDSTKTARLICDVYDTKNRTPFQGDSRYVLKNSLSEMRELLGKNTVFNTGPEIEYYLLKETENGYKAHDNGTYFDYSGYGVSEEIRKECALAMNHMGINFEAEHHEVGKGQHEIDFEFGDALIVADQVITCKLIIKMIASTYNSLATFMPKPFRREGGNAMHVNQSIYDVKKGCNMFSEDGELSEIAYYYIGGLLHHAKALTAVTNPTINSYKRLVPGYEAPVFITWGRCDRSSLIRIPVANEKNRRIELRTPDASCNPYLAFAAMLAAGLDGIKKKIDPGTEEKGIDYYNNDTKIDDNKKLPCDLNEALRELSKDDVIKNALGEIACKQLMSSGMFEWSEYSKEVSPWEFERYINI